MVITRALAAALILGSVATVSGADARVDAYRRAAAAGAFGIVTGHAWEERRRPDGAERPLTGTVVTLVPHSRALLSRLAPRHRAGAWDLRARPPADGFQRGVRLAA
jgi:hypothetical protein